MDRSTFLTIYKHFFGLFLIFCCVQTNFKFMLDSLIPDLQFQESYMSFHELQESHISFLKGILSDSCVHDCCPITGRLKTIFHRMEFAFSHKKSAQRDIWRAQTPFFIIMTVFGPKFGSSSTSQQLGGEQEFTLRSQDTTTPPVQW